jgi:hypothetical protein
MALCDIIAGIFGPLVDIPVIGQLFAAFLSFIGNVLGCG